MIVKAPELNGNKRFVLIIFPVIPMSKQCFSLIKRIILDSDLEAEIPTACLSRKSSCDGQQNIGIRSNIRLLTKLNLRNFSLYRLLFKQFLVNGMLTTLRFF